MSTRRPLVLAAVILLFAVSSAEAWPRSVVRHHRAGPETRPSLARFASHGGSPPRPSALLVRQAPPEVSPRAHGVIRSRHTVPSATIHVHDGDTFYSGGETIRLRGIDTPELGHPRSREATRRLIALLHEGPVTIVPRAEDVYGRTVADVYVDGQNVADVLRREGFAKRPSRP